MRLNKKQMLVMDYLTALSISQKNLLYIADKLYHAEDDERFICCIYFYDSIVRIREKIVRIKELINSTMFELLLESSYRNHNKFLRFLNDNGI
jgi:hypothetical protein